MDTYGDVEELHTQQKIHYLTYRKTGFYVLYPFLALLALTAIALLYFQRDIVIELNGMVSNTEAGQVIASSVAGQIEEITVNTLQFVDENDVLIQLDTTEIQRQIDLRQDEIDLLEDNLLYLGYFEESIANGRNLLPSDAFGYYSRVEHYLRNMESDGVELNLSAVEGESSRHQINSRITQLEHLIGDYESFRRIVDGLSYDSIRDEVVSSRVADFRANLGTLDYYTRNDYTDYYYTRHEIPAFRGEPDIYGYYEYIPASYEYVRGERTGYYYSRDDSAWDRRNIFLSNTRVQIQQTISNFRDEIRSLNSELSGLDRGLERERGSAGRNSLNASERLLMEIFEIRDRLSTQLDNYEREMVRFLEQYEHHTVRATGSGYFQLAEGMAIGNTLNAHSEIGRLIDPEQSGHYLVGFFPASDFNRVRVGQDVRFILVDGDNNRHPIGGRIEVVSQLPTRTEQGNHFMLHATMSREIPGLYLQYGIMGELNVITGRTTIFRYLINRFF
ncbi:MAG: hypothetical protein FWF59_03590 [Turicibacter sp.]|nr:hypothetical protein [Turicibacter sp.]